MRKPLFKTLLCLSLLMPFTGNGQERNALESGFMNPAEKVQTSVYWYWISGNISEEGVKKDLYSMKEAGINRAFIGNIGLEGIHTPYKTVPFYSEEWWKILHAALKTATELGIEIGIFNSPGWSQSGGPWVKPEQAMRYLASVKAEVSGGKQDGPVGHLALLLHIAHPLAELVIELCLFSLRLGQLLLLQGDELAVFVNLGLDVVDLRLSGIDLLLQQLLLLQSLALVRLDFLQLLLKLFPLVVQIIGLLF